MENQTNIYTFEDGGARIQTDRPQPLLEMLNQLESAAAMCEGDFAALMERLSPLLPPLVEGPDSDEVPDPFGGSPTLCRLHALLGRLMVLDTAIENLTNRLEV